MTALRASIGRRRRLLAGVGVLVLLAAIGVAVADPFAGHAATHDSSLDNGSPTSTRPVQRTSLASQTQVSGTLGYAGSRTVALPSGTDPATLAQDQQAVTSARSQLATAQASVSGDESTLTQARKTLATDRRNERTACHGSASTPAGCSAAKQAVTQDEANVAQAQQKLAADRPQLASARTGLTQARQALGAAEAAATSYGSSSSYTKLPGPGAVIRRGQALFAINGQPTLLLYGSTPAWRAFRAGMSPGADVAELNENLRALGYGAPNGDGFTSATSSAISALQQARGLAPTGSLLLGSVVFEPGALRVAAVTPTVGTPVQPGAVLTATSTRHDVSVQLDAAQQSEVKVGDRVTVTLPDNSTTPGVVSSVGKVATTPPSDQNGGGGSSTPTIDVEVRLLHPSAAGHLDKAPVEVSITEQSVHDVLAVPVEALVALAGGGYAVEAVEPGGAHQLVAVSVGLFDDAQGLVQVAGHGLAAGQHVVVPAS